MDYPRFTRMLRRSADIAAEPKMKPGIVLLYADVLQPVAEPYLAADAALKTAQSQLNARKIDAAAALAAIDEPYQAARALVAAYVAGVVLPDTLKAQPTETETVAAESELSSLILEHKGEPWADDLIAGPFGQLAPVAGPKIQDAVNANIALTKARLDRQKAYPAAYEAFVKFKKVVRTGLGRTSKQYQRINVREAPEKPTQATPAKAAPAKAAPAKDPPATEAQPKAPDPPAKPATPPDPALPASNVTD
jgi:hypothetical protein